MAIKAEKVMIRPDVVGLFRDFKSGGKPLTLAVRIKGPVKSAFPDGPPQGKDTGKDAPLAAAKKHLAQSAKPVNLIVVADVDMLHDRFWVDIRQLMGRQLLVPHANNADFVINSLDNLGGSDALIGLRGRAESSRPFHLVQEIRQDAERQFREKELSLQTKLQDVEGKLENLVRRRGTDSEQVLSPGDKAAIDKFRNEMVQVRKELRGVQRALRKDIDRLDGLLKFINIAAIPLILGFAALLAAIIRTRRRARALLVD
jgi:ABC-type uncharacterized transport system involved in gliding motility auxiliary subunit